MKKTYFFQKGDNFLQANGKDIYITSFLILLSRPMLFSMLVVLNITIDCTVSFCNDLTEFS